MKKETQNKEKKQKKEEKKEEIKCEDKKCPIHGEISVRGRTFKGFVKKIIQGRAVIEWERIIYIRKYERYLKKKSRIHAHIPSCLLNDINVGSHVKAKECRPLSKIIKFIVIEVIKK